MVTGVVREIALLMGEAGRGEGSGVGGGVACGWRSVRGAGLLGNLLLDDIGGAVAERTLLLDELLELRDVLLYRLDAARVVVAGLVDCLGKGDGVRNQGNQREKVGAPEKNKPW